MLHSTSHVLTKQPLLSPGRTQGDGMESESESSPEDVFRKKSERGCSLGDKLIYRPSDLKQYSSTPPIITGKIVNLVPKQVTPAKKDSSIVLGLKGKEPKFIPYEPYKAAVKPIIPFDKKKNLERKVSKKHELPIVPPVIPSVENGTLSNSSLSVDSNIQNDQGRVWETERKAMQEEIKTLKDENGQLESQLKFQAQVNGELKALLVAAVGEDLETRVHLLTEDKLQLARALLSSAQRLSTHQEQTEWLAGQCEVWRSKFLASSLMVEELAKWKAALGQRTTELQESMKRLLEERTLMRDSLLNAYRDLCVLRHHFDHTKLAHCDLPSSNVLDLSAGCQRLGNVLKLQLLGSGLAIHTTAGEPDLTGLDMRTLAEKNAENLLLSPNTLLLTGPDAACSAVMGAAVAVGALGPAPMAMKCCAHCSGEVKMV
ncbi:hypothetical protein R5R35_009626 [Gryllus longicercus]|uniref:Golgin-45 n=1 Tax=Gryllus longicercus TaxID=2509291 RepID=A0AAN9V3M6_9ORTH